MDKTNKNLFNNTELAFSNKSNFELKKAYYLFRFLDFHLLTKFGNFFLILFLKLRLPIKGIIRQTIFHHFCGGENIKDCIPVFKSLSKYNILAMPEYSIEAESTFEGFESYKNNSMDLTEYLGRLNLPFLAIKCTGLISIDALEKISSGELNSKSNEYINFKNRMKELCDSAKYNNVRILVDAEESWIQKAINKVTLKLMEIYNKKHAIIFLTYQCYKIDTLNNIFKDFKYANKNSFKLGVKLVRGAYMEKERAHALKYEYNSPIHINKNNTDDEFNNSIEFCIKNLNNISLWVGSHNENSFHNVINLMNKKKIKKNDDRVWFSQLYGMSDNISFTLASLGYNILKLIPFGPIEKTIPYLIRRANENSSVKGQSNRQYTLIKHEINRRKDLN